MTASEKQNKQQLPSVISLLSHTLEIYTKHFSLLFGFAAWLLLPVVISFFAQLGLAEPAASVIQTIALLIVYPIITIWLMLAITLLIPDLASNSKPRLTTLNSRIRRAAIPFIFTLILVNVLQLLGFIALIVPGIIFSVWFAFSAIIVVLEQKNVIDSLKKSRTLSEGRFFSVLWRLFVGALIILTFYIGLSAIASIIFATFSGQDLLTFVEAPPTLGEEAITQIIDILILPISIIYPVLLYLTLKNKKA